MKKLLMPLLFVTYTILLLVVIQLIKFVNEEAKPSRSDPAAAFYNCEVGASGRDQCGVQCMCECSGRAEDQKSGVYDYSHTTGCLGSQWLCQGKPCSKIIANKISDSH
jgi:hypothetical protein